MRSWPPGASKFLWATWFAFAKNTSRATEGTWRRGFRPSRSLEERGQTSFTRKPSLLRALVSKVETVDVARPSEYAMSLFE